MKKITILLVLLCVGFTTVNAQKVKIGVKGGINFSNIYGDNSEGIDFRTGVHIGVMTELSLSSKFSFQPELLYSQQGAKVDAVVFISNFDFELITIEARYDYLNLPLMMKYYIVKGFNVQFGPQIGFLIAAKQEAEGITVDAKDSVKGVDFGLNAGLGYRFDNGLNIEARYNLGLSDINDVSGLSDKNNYGVIQASIGYFFK